MTRYAYANTPYTREEYQEAIVEAYAQAEGLYEHSERLHAEADRWWDRASTLEMELIALEDEDETPTEVITINPVFFDE
jgi:predicted nuclease with TOPRIM domain